MEIWTKSIIMVRIVWGVALSLPVQRIISENSMSLSWNAVAEYL